MEEAQKEIDAAQKAEPQEFTQLITDFSGESQAALNALEQGNIPTPDQIRALLRDSGIPEDQVNLASDEELIQLFQEVSSQQ